MLSFWLVWGEQIAGDKNGRTDPKSGEFPLQSRWETMWLAKGSWQRDESRMSSRFSTWIT